MSFTLAFDGYIGKFDLNPLSTETPFGVPVACGYADQFAIADIYREALESIIAHNPSDHGIEIIAQRALDEAASVITDEIKAIRHAKETK